MATPLKKILFLNFEHAIELGLLNAPSAQISAIKKIMDDVWSKAPSDEAAFDLGVQYICRLCGHMVWLEYKDKNSGDLVIIHRVATVENLNYPLEATLGEPGRLIKGACKELKKLIEAEITRNATGPHDEFSYKKACKRLKEVCEDLREILSKNSSASRLRAKIKASALHSTKAQAWVVPDSDKNSSMSGQETRDWLGLIHYPKPGYEYNASQLLVRMKFEARISHVELPEKYDKDFLNKEVKGAWLIRPTVCHAPNTRFSQRHGDDRHGIARYGRTIDISNAKYDYCEQELILLHGDDAELTWIDLELLNPVPKRNSIDDDHDGFLNVMMSR